MPTVTACLIVRDEARNLGRCLASLAGQVDEVVVVDTGSTDDTLAIAEAHGARVAEVAWQDDFAAARNASLEMATADYVLVIDADETLEAAAGWAAGLVEEIHAVELVNLGVDDRVLTRAYLPRVFRRREAHRYQGRLGEELGPLARADAEMPRAIAAVRLRHVGFQPEQMRLAAKAARNLALAARMVEEDPANPLAHFVLARACWLADLSERAVEAFAALRACPRRLPPGPSQNAFKTEALLYQELGQPGKALEVLDEGTATWPLFPELHWERGRLRQLRGDLGGARADFMAARDGGNRAWPGVVREGCSGYRPNLALALIALGLGEPVGNALVLVQAAFEDPDFPALERDHGGAIATLLAELDRPSTPPPAVPPTFPPPLPARPRISACLLARNAAASLPRCLASLRGRVDETVVVDLGSQDDTVALAVAAGARVTHEIWAGDFAAARNAGLELASGDWILAIDADEELVIHDEAAWHAALADAQVGGYAVGGTRLFRRHPALRFEGALHESVDPALAALGWVRAALPAAEIDLAVPAEAKWAGLLATAEQHVVGAPEEPAAWYRLATAAQQLGAMERATEAYARLSELLAAGGRLGGWYHAGYVWGYARLLAAAGEDDRALDLIEEGLVSSPANPALYRARAERWTARGREVAALLDLIAASALERR